MKSRRKRSRPDVKQRAFRDLATEDVTAGAPPTADSMHINNAWSESCALFDTLVSLDLPSAETYLGKHPPSLGAIAFLVFTAPYISELRKLWDRSKKPRTKSLIEQVRKAGLQRYADAKVKAPALFEKYSRNQLTQAISKAKRSK